MKALIDYDKRMFHVKFLDVIKKFDLKEGDVGDYWNSLNEHFDINYYQENGNEVPIVTIYNVVNGKIDMTNYSEMEVSTIGDHRNYFNIPNN